MYDYLGTTHTVHCVSNPSRFLFGNLLDFFNFFTQFSPMASTPPHSLKCCNDHSAFSVFPGQFGKTRSICKGYSESFFAVCVPTTCALQQQHLSALNIIEQAASNVQYRPCKLSMFRQETLLPAIPSDTSGNPPPQV